MWKEWKCISLQCTLLNSKFSTSSWDRSWKITLPSGRCGQASVFSINPTCRLPCSVSALLDHISLVALIHQQLSVYRYSICREQSMYTSTQTWEEVKSGKSSHLWNNFGFEAIDRKDIASDTAVCWWVKMQLPYSDAATTHLKSPVNLLLKWANGDTSSG